MTEFTATPVQLDTEAELDAFIERHECSLVEFYAEGCPLCQAMGPVLGNVARSTAVAIGLVNPRDDLELVDRFEIQSVPTLVLFRAGEPIATRADGFLGGDEVVAFLEANAPVTVADGD
ncbi:thioredoxin family protein [Natrialba asiatica]|uniref:Thioredoxin n=1 Tax=Natrialba asiatica (strain ATCC 700177 / DSM 12278 / JCM 9576 / FERM P-10747 / NBRC 102637 / 172P1) TaxID=29540 RepID=M0ANQ4_NATA1|nr:thioredoxin domain-containing protein [Natrialba asiatica]ELZ00371.1 thioredoxin [Natrialba asiatica DSM 12278]